MILGDLTSGEKSKIMLLAAGMTMVRSNGTGDIHMNNDSLLLVKAT
jgi:hypothetical protein